MQANKSVSATNYSFPLLFSKLFLSHWPGSTGEVLTLTRAIIILRLYASPLYSTHYSLDIETIDALSMALSDYTGGILVVSHDARLLQTVCDELWICEEGSVRKFNGEFREYRQDLVTQLRKRSTLIKRGAD